MTVEGLNKLQALKFGASCRPALALPLCFAMLCAGCGSKPPASNQQSATNAPGAVSPAARATPAPGPTPTATPAASGNAQNRKPEEVAEKLLTAWKNNDRNAARMVASESAIADLFKQRGRAAAQYISQPCQSFEGGFYCVFASETGDLVMEVNGDDSTGYRVEAIEFNTD